MISLPAFCHRAVCQLLLPSISKVHREQYESQTKPSPICNVLQHVTCAGSILSAASPPVSPLPPASPGLSTPAAVPGLSLGPGAVDKPSFGMLLAASLKSEGVTKAWFDEACGYIHVKQSRVPLELPKVRGGQGYGCGVRGYGCGVQGYWCAQMH